MALGSERYQTTDIFICKDTYIPKGICYGGTCKATSLRTKVTDIKETVKLYIGGAYVGDLTNVSGKKVDISVSLSPVDAVAQSMTAYMMPVGSDVECMLAYPPCRDIDMEDGVKWSRSGDFIIAEMPLAEHCAVESFKTQYETNIVRFDTISHIGEADGEDVTLTFDDGGFTYHRTSLSDTYLIPGEQAFIFYKLRGVPEYYPLAYIDFQTTIFTSATFIGCGLVKRTKVYANPVRPELGYSYEYLPYEGGIGETVQPEWTYETDYRICVSYRGANYWLKSTDFAPYEDGDRVFIAKGLSTLPLNPEDPDQSDADKTLSESSDYVIPENFYGAGA